MDLSPAADRTDMSDKASELSDTESSDMSYLVDDADLYRAGNYPQSTYNSLLEDFATYFL